MIAEAIKKIVDKQDLNYDEAYQVMSEIMDGKTSQVQNAAYLAALSTKSTHAETIDEISGSAAAMRDHALAVDAGPDVLDIVGTGGDNAQTFNISTTSAFVIAADGVRVAKHGNRAASSQCGTADCLEALGATIAVEPADAARMVDEVGMCFLFAQKYHASMRFVGSIRRELGIRTVFNILGPLTNPAHPAYMVLGVYDGALAEPLAKVLTDLGVRRAFVVYGTDCLDEISASAPTMVCEVRDGFYRTIEVTPEQFGLTRCERADLAGGTPDENAAIVRAVLSGEQGPRRTAVLMNAGAALYVAGHADTMAAGIERAAALVDDGSALAKLDEFVAATQACAPKDAR